MDNRCADDKDVGKVGYTWLCVAEALICVSALPMNGTTPMPSTAGFSTQQGEEAEGYAGNIGFKHDF